jgi:hypothetical protein
VSNVDALAAVEQLDKVDVKAEVDVWLRSRSNYQCTRFDCVCSHEIFDARSGAVIGVV